MRVYLAASSLGRGKDRFPEGIYGHIYFSTAKGVSPVHRPCGDLHSRGVIGGDSGGGGGPHNRTRRSENVISFIARSHFPNDIRPHRTSRTPPLYTYTDAAAATAAAVICHNTDTLLETEETRDRDGRTIEGSVGDGGGTMTVVPGKGTAGEKRLLPYPVYRVYYAIAGAVCACCFDLSSHCKQIGKKRRRVERA